MRTLSPEGQHAVASLSQRHGVSEDAVAHMLEALVAGQGGMAQFNHREFGGSGQWMRGGMTMVSDLFDHALKARVDALCRDLSELLLQDPGAVTGGSSQSQSQGAGPGRTQHQHSNDGSRAAPATTGLFTAAAGGGSSSGHWWPDGLGQPGSTGAQNDVRYAHFPQSRRLAIDQGDGVVVYDTGDHQIGGFSQQQSGSGSMSFQSQHGPVDVASLRVVSGGDAGSAVPAASPAASAPARSEPSAHGSSGSDVCATIERLADLRAKGVLTDDEFARKKADLLARL